MNARRYGKELCKLQGGLCRLQVVFESRAAAGRDVTGGKESLPLVTIPAR